MRELDRPDYDNSLLSVASSVLRYYGVPGCTHASQPALDAALAKKPQNVVVMLFDGMGVSLLEKHLPPDSFLRSHMRETISSVFPPTTVAATTTIQSGLSPAEHGWLGWTLYFKEAGANVAVFANKNTETGRPAAPEHLAQTCLPYENLCGRIMRAAPDVKAENVSFRARVPVFSVASSCRRVAQILRGPGRHYIYCYWINPDHLIHKYGVTAAQVHKNIRRIDQQTEKCAAA